MRKELENIQKIEKYLNGELTSAQKESFENELKSNSELLKAYEQVKAFRVAVFRTELRKKIENNAPRGGGFSTHIIVGITILILGVLSWFYLNQNPAVQDENFVMVEQNDSIQIVTTSSSDTSVAIVPSVANNLNAQAEIVSIERAELGGHKLWMEPDIQYFNFLNKEGTTIEGKDGMLVIVPANAFIDSIGNPVQGTVEFKLLEAFGISEMVLYNLKTVSNGSHLESGGMFYLEASVNGNSVQVNPKRPLYIEIPTAEKKDGMMAFTGKVSQEGDINWVNPKPLEKYLVKMPLGELDFLPEGFADEVESNMPFLTYKETTSSVTDSLYYSLSRDGVVMVIEDESIFGSESIKWGRKRRKPNMVGDVIADTIEVINNTVSEKVIEEVSDEVCGIDPISIETIKLERFSNTFIATKEFEKRLVVLHKATNGDELLQIYIENLNDDLYVSDAQVAKIIDEDLRPTFESFANEKLTNIQYPKFHQQRLTTYYRKKRKELQKSHNKLAEKLANKNGAELESILSELKSIEQKSRVDNLISSVPNRNVVNSNVYATQWSTMGWGNIDAYMKLLAGKPLEIEVFVSSTSEGIEVTQWLGGVNTYTGLAKMNASYIAVFPKKQKGSSSKTHVFAISKTGESYQWGMMHYNPYEVSSVTITMKKVSITEIEKELIGVEMNFGKLKERQIRKEKEMQRMVERQLEINEKRRVWAKKRNKIYKKYNAASRKQIEVQQVMSELRGVAFNCVRDGDILITDIDDNGVFTIVDNMPQFVGGESRMYNLLNKNFRYPEMAKNNNVTGIVYVSFIISPEGKIYDAKVIKGIGSGCDEEALRVVNLMPLWKPGSLDGVNVPVRYTVTIKFMLE